jgi:hypothetical protein
VRWSGSVKGGEEGEEGGKDEFLAAEARRRLGLKKNESGVAKRGKAMVKKDDGMGLVKSPKMNGGKEDWRMSLYDDAGFLKSSPLRTE